MTNQLRMAFQEVELHLADSLSKTRTLGDGINAINALTFIKQVVASIPEPEPKAKPKAEAEKAKPETPAPEEPVKPGKPAEKPG